MKTNNIEKVYMSTILCCHFVSYLHNNRSIQVNDKCAIVTVVMYVLFTQGTLTYRILDYI